MSDILKAPPEEGKITEGWSPARGDLVSVCMLTYNHAPYLRDALNSILNQKTNFGFEILVHDDASQDGSQKIIEEYAARYPKIIKPILQKVNQHSQKIYPSVYFNYPRANLPFMAMCEGDDHWTDPQKLQKQIDGLIAHPDINLSFHSALFVDHSDPQKATRIYGDYDTTDATIPFKKIMHRVRGWIPTASCVIRQDAKIQFLDFLKAGVSYLTVGDIYLQFFGALSGGALFFAKPMSLYRYRTEQSWTKKVQRNPAFKAAHEIAMIRSYHELDRITENTYHDDFIVLTLQRLLWLFTPSEMPPPRDVAGVATMEAAYAACESEIRQTLSRLGAAEERYVIFGCGSGCKQVLDALPAEKIAAIVDRDNRRIGESMSGKPIIGTKDLATYHDCALIVSTIAPEQEAVSLLAEDAGIPGKRIHYLFDGALGYLASHPISPDIFEP